MAVSQSMKDSWPLFHPNGSFTEHVAVSSRRLKLTLITGQVAPKRFHHAKFFSDGHFLQWQRNVHETNLPLLEEFVNSSCPVGPLVSG